MVGGPRLLSTTLAVLIDALLHSPITNRDAVRLMTQVLRSSDFIVTPERIIDCRPGRGPRRRPAIDWADLTDEKIAAIPLLTALRAAD